MRIALGGVPGAGKSTVAKLIAEKLHYDFYSVGSIRRKLAMDRGLTIDEFNSLKEDTDTMADEYQKRLGETSDNFVIEGRLAFYFVPNSVKIYFECDLGVAAERIMKDPRNSEKVYKNASDAKKALKERMANDTSRYKKLYGIGCYNPKHFDYVIDTTRITIDEVVKKVLGKLGQKK